MSGVVRVYSSGAVGRLPARQRSTLQPPCPDCSYGLNQPCGLNGRPVAEHGQHHRDHKGRQPGDDRPEPVAVLVFALLLSTTGFLSGVTRTPPSVGLWLLSVTCTDSYLATGGHSLTVTTVRRQHQPQALVWCAPYVACATVYSSPADESSCWIKPLHEKCIMLR